MKKIFILLISLFCFHDSIVGQIVGQIGNGNLSPANTMYAPVYRFSAGSSTNTNRSNIIFEESELQAIGLVSGMEITQIAFNKTNNGTFNSGIDYTIRMANSSATAPLPGTIASEWNSILANHTTVYSSSSFNVPSTSGWVDIILDNPFIYTGGTLEISFDQDMTGVGATDAIKWEYTAGFSDYMIGATEGNSNLASYRYRPNIKLTFQTTTPCSGQPTAALSSSDTSVCPNIGFSILGQGVPNSGIEYQWQESPAGQNIWTNISGGTNLVLNVANGITDDTDYRFIITCTNSNLSDTSDVMEVTVNSATDCYCIPNATSGDYLNTIDIETDIDNHLYTASSQPTNPIKGYDDQLSQVIETYVGDEVEVNTLYTGGSNTVKIWVDWNEDGVFDEVNELMDEGYVSSATTVNDLSFIVPNGVAAGDYRMRIRGRFSTTNFTPCSTETYGSAVDFTLRVITLSDCSDADAGTISSTATEACSDEDFTLSASGMTGPGNGLTYQWQESPAGANTWTDIAGANSSSVTINGVSDDTDYRLVVECSFGNLADTSNVVTVNASPALDCYCTPSTTSGTTYHITNFSTNGGATDINNSSTGNSTGYEDYTNISVSTYAGATIDYTITTSGTTYTYGRAMWIDWNQDGVFDASEKVLSSSSYASGPFTGDFTVPAGVQPGDYRLRVLVSYTPSNPNDPCTNSGNGEYEDYTVNIFALTDCTDADAGTISSTSTNVCEDEDFTLSATGMTGPGNGLTYQWQESPAGANTWTDIAGANSPNLTINGVSDDTDYRFVVACSFGNLEDTSNVVTVNLKPANECYCIPPTPNFTDLYWIHSVETSNAYDDFSNVTAGYSTGGYGDFYDTHMVVVEEGGDFDLEVQSRNGAVPGIKVWIDWDQSGTFDANELVYESNTGSTSATNTYTTNIQVPANALTGTTRMRVRNYNSGTSLAPCNSMSYGETEDYAVKIGVCEDPDVDLGPDVTICEGESITLDAGNPGLDYEWSTNETTQTITVNSAGTYTVTVTDGACSTTESITVTVQALPVVDLGADTHICDGETLTLDAGNPGADYEWNDNSTGQTLDVTSGGTYSVTVTEGNCSASDEIVITELPAPSASGINTNNAFDCLFGFTVTNPQNVNEYIWDFGDGSPTETTTNANNSHNFANSGTYVVSVTLVNDCADDVVITQEITCDDGVSIDEMDNAKQLIVYPNPAKDLVTIEGGESVVMKHITVYNVVGQKVYDGKANTATVHTMDVSQLASGMYTVRIETQNGVMIKKFEVVK